MCRVKVATRLCTVLAWLLAPAIFLTAHSECPYSRQSIGKLAARKHPDTATIRCRRTSQIWELFA